MPRRTLFFTIFALAAAAVCVRLGVWQISRGRERRVANAHIEARLVAPPAPFAAVAALGDSARFRRVRVEGVADYSRELLHGARTRDGSPGVHLLTPVRVAGSESLVLVNRGWVYSPDGASVDRARWREGDTLLVTGFVELLAADSTRAAVAQRAGSTILRTLDRSSVAATLASPVSGAYVVATSIDSRPARSSELPVRLAPPALGEGPHTGYAIQWFAFAAIAIIGTAVIWARSRPPARPGV